MSRRALLKTLAAGSVGLATGVGACGFYERDSIGLTEIEVPVARLPRGLAGLRIGLITDVHHSRWVSADDVAAAATLLLSGAPDLIVLGGDYVTWGDAAFAGPAAEALSSLSAPHGVFGILGNHDSEDMADSLSAKGVQMLKDSRTRLKINGDPLELAGLRYWTQRQMDIASVLRGARDTVILLAHDPRRLREAVAFNVPLILSGHTHGGQVVLPWVGAVAARKFPVISGVSRREQTTIFVSRGVGTVYVPMRINCPPEVAIVTLAPDPAQPLA
jgi:predicted MPP superfamily phosphohydrolase